MTASWNREKVSLRPAFRLQRLLPTDPWNCMKIYKNQLRSMKYQEAEIEQMFPMKINEIAGLHFNSLATPSLEI